jgi:hypothetical protein
MPDSTVLEPKANENGERSPDRAAKAFAQVVAARAPAAEIEAYYAPRYQTGGVPQPAPAQTVPFATSRRGAKPGAARADK